MARLLVLLLAIFSGGAALAADLPLFPPLSGFSLLDPAYPPPPGGPFPYSETAGPLQFHVGPWGSPGGKMPPFTRHGDSYTTAAPASAVTITQGPDGETLALEQDGAKLACNDAAGRPQEFDFFAGPNGPEVQPPRQSGLEHPDLPIEGLTHLTLSADITMSVGLAATRKHCQANFADAVFAVILTDTQTQPAQVFFYQLMLGRLCGDNPGMKLSDCRQQRDTMQTYSASNPFGADDVPPAMGAPWLTPGRAQHVQLDLAPCLRLAITQGAGPLDHDTAHWRLGNVYFGQIIFGDTHIHTSWRNLRLVAQTP